MKLGKIFRSGTGGGEPVNSSDAVNICRKLHDKRVSSRTGRKPASSTRPQMAVGRIAAAEMHQRALFLSIVVSQCNYGTQTWMHRSNISVMSLPGAAWMEHLLNNAFVLLVHIILWENAIRNISISLCLLHEIAFFSRAELKHHCCAIRKLKTVKQGVTTSPSGALSRWHFCVRTFPL